MTTPHARLAALLIALVLLAALPGSVDVALAEDGDPEELPAPTQLGPDAALPPKPMYSRLDSLLNQMVEQVGDVAAQEVATSAPLYQGTAVAVTVRVLGDTSNTLAFLVQSGATVANVGPDYIEAYVPVTSLVALAGRESVLRVSAIVPPRAAITSQGAALHGSPVWNERGSTGAGLKVGIIDVGFEGYNGLIGTELPAPALARCYTAVGAFTSSLADCENGEVHGAAVAEAVIDIAPGVSLYVANPLSFGDLLSTAAWMVSHGVTVINMSLAWLWDGPGDGTSPFIDSALSTVDLAVSGGAVWVNAAGNAALSNWFGGYSDVDSDGWLEFAAGIEGNDVELTAGTRLTAQARWEDSWTNPSRDFDLYLYDSSQDLVAFSDNEQSGGAGQVPWEGFFYTPTVSGTYFLSIRHFSGTVPQWLQLNAFTGQNLGVAVAATSIENPAESANRGLVAVGAANWATPSTIEPFSSRGPTTDGRVKPDTVGADRGDSASYGPGGFFGTSQAAPHVAGLAALVRQRFPGLTPAQVADYLEMQAEPRGGVPNNDWGFGLAQLPALTPGPPTSVTAVAGSGEATVSWSAPPDGGNPITQYVATSAPEGHVAVVSGSTLSASVAGLTDGTGYTFTVTATNAVGISGPSAPSNAVTPLGPPGPPSVVTAVAGNSEATVSWSAPISDGGSPITQYTAQSDPGGHLATVDAPTLSATVTGLTNGTAYTFTVTATNALGTSEPSAPSIAVTPVGPPTPPRQVTAVSGNSEATVSWIAPIFDGGSPITQYAATSTPGGHLAAVDGSTLSATVAGLTNGTGYIFTVTATNAVGTSGPSAPSNDVTPLGPPSQPRDVTAAAGDGEVTVMWSAPTLDGGSPITQYTATSDPDGQVDVVNGSTLRATVTGLTNGVLYTFVVTATNAIGTSIGSEPSPPIAPQGPTPIPAHTALGLLALFAVAGLLLAIRAR